LVTEFPFSNSLPGIDLGPIFHFYEFGLIDDESSSSIKFVSKELLA
jgi:hypothetical protein